MRASLGAAPGQVFRQLLTESLVLAAIGGAIGVGLAWVLLQAIVAAMPPYTLPSEADVRLNVPVMLFTLGISMALRRPLRLRAGVAGDAREHERDPEGRRPLRRRRPPPAAPRARRRGVRAGAHAARRRRPCHPQPDQAGERRPRLPDAIIC